MMPAPMGQGGPQMLPSTSGQLHAQPPPQHQQPSAAQQIEMKYDNVAKVKMLIWSLKESLGNVMRVAGANIYHTAAGKSGEDMPQRTDKVLEDFFSICNQVELHLKTIQECTVQQKESAQYLPLHVMPGRSEAMPNQLQDGQLSYTHYLSTTKGQVNFAKDVQEMLNEGAKNIIQMD